MVEKTFYGRYLVEVVYTKDTYIEESANKWGFTYKAPGTVVEAAILEGV